MHRQFAFLTVGDLHRVRCVRMVTDPDGSTGISRTWRRGELPAASDEQAATTIEAHSATDGNAGRDGAEVSSGHSSVSVLHESDRS